MSRGGKTAIGVAVALPVLLAFVFLVLLDTYRLPSESMAPTYDPGSRVLAGRTGFPFGGAGRGDVVIVTPSLGAADLADRSCGAEQRPDQACPKSLPEKSDVKFIQRIVAVGGDRLKIERGRALVNGRPLDEPYARLDAACEVCNLPRAITIPDGHVFLMGDNRGRSIDSRATGPVPEDWVVGKVLFRYWGG